MNRRGFIGLLAGGIAASAAVRTWPFKVFSFPLAVKPVKLDLGFNVFDYAGLPMIEDTLAKPNTIYLLDKHIWAMDGKVIRQVDTEVVVPRPLSHCRIEGLQI